MRGIRLLNGVKQNMEKLYLGVSKKIITPEVGGNLYGYRPDVISEKIEDDLTATCFYFCQGGRQALMISVTVGSLATALYDDLAAKIEQTFSIPKQNCVISATHTHSAPNTCGEVGWGDLDEPYINGILAPQIMSGVAEAIAARQPVTVGCAVGNSFVGVSRRELTGENITVLGQNPHACFDPRMTVISFKNEAGQAVANMIHYACHGTAAGCNKEVSRDWSGVMTDELERVSGAITAFFNGPEGDIGPRLSNGGTAGDGIRRIYEIGWVGARDAVQIYKTIKAYHPVELVCGGGDIAVSMKERIPREEAQALFDQFGADAINSELAQRHYAQLVLDAYESGKPEIASTPLHQSVIALGSLVFVTFPYELFSQIGLRIDDCFAGQRVLSLSNANGSMGYFITEEAKCRGGYEVDMFYYSGHDQPYCDNADFELMQKTVQHIQDVLKEGNR